MKNIKKSGLELIGQTPLLELTNFEKEHQLKAKLIAKLEYLNPAGSTKDRAVLYMIKDAEESGVLQPGATIIEPTSGNTGIGLASIAAMKGYHAMLTM
ncbi:MAG: pyridoxal-phosphate dependent enzyme, partial [Hungatella sp.]